MKSHRYDLRPADLVRLLGGLLVPIVIFAVTMRLGAFIEFLPAPWPALDVDRTILTHQAHASRMPTDADVLLIGDSSCLMDVSGAKLEDAFAGNHHGLNLGSSMYVGLNGYAAMMSRYAEANPGRLQRVVLLLHPEMLRGVAPVPSYLVFISDFYAGADEGDFDFSRNLVSGLCGLDIFRGRLLSRIPRPLPKQYGRFYGFNLDLYGFMDRQRGSAVDPHRYTRGPGQGNAEYRLAPVFQSGGAALKAAVPPGAKLIVGLTPVPESFAPPGYAARWQRILQEWGQWTRADQLLTNLPPALPDAWFASTTHLNEAGAVHYAELVAGCLDPGSVRRGLSTAPGLSP